MGILSEQKRKENHKSWVSRKSRVKQVESKSRRKAWSIILDATGEKKESRTGFVGSSRQCGASVLRNCLLAVVLLASLLLLKNNNLRGQQGPS